MKMSQSEREELIFQLGQVFRPAMPINREDLFSGRQAQIREVIDAINQGGQHIILWGERGVGKTSLANMIMYRIRWPGRRIMTPHINCTSVRTADAIWIAILDDIRFRAERQGISLPRPIKKLANDFDNGLRLDFPPELARRMVEDLADDMVLVFIIDEFDTIEDQSTRQTMAETIKFFSDRNVPATIVLVGVAEDVKSLIADHQSTARCLVQVRMPRMSRDEIEAIVTTSLGNKNIKMTIEASALHEISRIAKGLPHYAHLLGLHSGRQAIDAGSKKISQKHLAVAIKSAIQKALVPIQDAYLRATTSTKPNALYRQVLLACSLAATDEFGYFSPSDVRGPLELVLGRAYGVEAFARHLHTFCDEDRGPVLKKGDLANRPRFRFFDPLMQPFVLMKGLDEGLVTEDHLRATRDTKDQQGRLF